jgi:hypothetical protein
LQSSRNYGVKLFCLLAFVFFIPTENASAILESSRQSGKSSFGLLFLLAIAIASIWLYYGMLRWRSRHCPALPLILVGGAAAVALIASDLAYQRWWPNPFEPYVTQYRYGEWSRCTRMSWSQGGEVWFWDYLDGGHPIRMSIGPARAEIRGEIVSLDGQTCNWQVVTNDGRSLDVRIDGVHHEPNQHGVYQFHIAQQHGRIVVGNDGHIVDGEAEDGAADRKMMKPPSVLKWRGGGVRRTSLYWITSGRQLTRLIYDFVKSHGRNPRSLVGEPPMVDLQVQFLDGFEGGLSVEKARHRAEDEIRGRLLFDGGKTYKWEVLSVDGETCEVVLNGRNYALTDGRYFHLTEHGGQLRVEQESRGRVK